MSAQSPLHLWQELMTVPFSVGTWHPSPSVAFRAAPTAQVSIAKPANFLECAVQRRPAAFGNVHEDQRMPAKSERPIDEFQNLSQALARLSRPGTRKLARHVRHCNHIGG